MDPTREVVITGLGVVSPIGIGGADYWASLREQRSGVHTVAELAEAGFPVPIGGQVRNFEPKQYVKPRKSLKVMCHEVQMGFSAAAMALAEAGLDGGGADPDRFGVVFGSEMLYCDVNELEDTYRACLQDGDFDFARWGNRGMHQLYPLWMLKYLPNMAACHIGIAYDARGPNNTIVQGEASSLLALIEAVRGIQRGMADVIIAGGSGSRLSLTPLMYRGAKNLSHRIDTPAAASRPFDAHRDGSVNGEGGGAFVLESRRHAEARGAKPIARIVGLGQGYDTRGNEGSADGQGLQVAIRAALRDAGLEAAEIGHVNAHGNSTSAEDRREARAIRAMLGDVPVTAPKSFFGNLGAGGGAAEMVASVLALQHSEVPVTLNYEQPDPDCPVNVVRDRPLLSRQNFALVLNQSGTGQTAAVVIARA